MKKTVLIAAIAGLAFVACKKDRTCACTHTIISKTSDDPNYTYTSQPPTTSSTVYTKIKKNNALAQSCVTQNTTKTSNRTVVSGSVTTNYVVTTVTRDECALK